MYQYTRCESYGTPLDFIAFFWVFSYTIDEHSCLKYCILTKLSQMVYLYLINMYILKCQHTKCDCRLFHCVIWEFSCISTCLI